MKQGFTLLEVMISSAIFVIVCGMAMTFSVSAVTQTEITTADAAVQVGLVRITELIDAELAQSAIEFAGKLPDGTNDISPVEQIQPFPELTGTGADHVIFRKVGNASGQAFTGPTEWATIWSEPITYKLIPATGEIPGNGIDENGNGVADEMWFERVQPPEPTEAPIASRILTRDVNFVATATQPMPLRFLLVGKLMEIEMQYATGSDEGVRKFHISIALDAQ